MAAMAGIFKSLQEVLSTPVTLTGRPLSAEELRRKRAAKARRRLQDVLERGQTDTEQTVSFTLQGTIDLGPDSSFCIAGNNFVIDDGTWMLGKVALGATATVKGIVEADGKRIARSIVVTKSA